MLPHGVVLFFPTKELSWQIIFSLPLRCHFPYTLSKEMLGIPQRMSHSAF